MSSSSVIILSNVKLFLDFSIPIKLRNELNDPFDSHILRIMYINKRENAQTSQKRKIAFVKFLFLVCDVFVTKIY